MCADIQLLRPLRFLNDSLIDFYLLYAPFAFVVCFFACLLLSVSDRHHAQLHSKPHDLCHGRRCFCVCVYSIRRCPLSCAAIIAQTKSFLQYFFLQTPYHGQERQAGDRHNTHTHTHTHTHKQTNKQTRTHTDTHTQARSTSVFGSGPAALISSQKISLWCRSTNSEHLLSPSLALCACTLFHHLHVPSARIGACL